jgi:DNA-binding SARP family transcriptional activator
MIALRLFGTVWPHRTDAVGRQSRIHLQPKRLALLCYLAASSGLRVPRRRDQLLGLFWPESGETSARAALRQAIHGLRRALGPDVILTQGDEEIVVVDNALFCDVRAFQHSLDAGRTEMALALYRGDFMAGFYLKGASIEFERWIEIERERLRARAAAAALALSERDERAADFAAAARWAHRALTLSGFDETILRRLLVLYDRIGDRAEAMHAYDVFSRQLREEYEVAPSRETRSVMEEVRRKLAPSPE